MTTWPAPCTTGDSPFGRSLARALAQRTEALAESIPGKGALRVASAWVYTSLLAAWAGDHGLIPAVLRAPAEPARTEYLRRGGSPLGWMAGAVACLAAHPSTACLADPRYNPAAATAPSEGAVAELIDWWAGDAPPLAFPVESGPATITGWLPGDMLQLADDERRLAHALAQSPWWLADFILDRTLPPAAREHPDQTLRLIDPTCGTGHMLIRAVEQLWELYTTGTLPSRPGRADEVIGWRPVTPTVASRRIIAGVDGVELDPLTTAVARLRVTVMVAHLLHTAGALSDPLTLATIPHWIGPRIACGDSLLAGKVTPEVYAAHRPGQAAIVNLGAAAEESGQLGLFSGEAA